MIKQTAALVLSLIATAGLVGCGEGSPGGPLTKVSLQLNWFPEPEFGGFYEAQRAKLFEEAGLDVTLLAGGPGVPAVQMVASGRVPFGIASADQVVQARAQGVPVVALFAVYQTSPQGIMVHASSDIQDLAGVFAPRDPTLTLAVQDLPYVTWLKSRYDFSNVREVAYQGGVSQFVHDKDYAQQCFVTFEPYAADFAGAPARSFLIADSGFNPYAGVVITREDYLKNNEAICRKLVDAMREGWARYLQDPGPANTLMLPMNPGETAESFVKASTRQIDLIQTDAGLGTMTLDRWQTLIDQMVKVKLIPQTIDAAACMKTFANE